MTIADRLQESINVLKSYTAREWLHLAINELIHLTVVFLFVMALQIHIDSKEYAFQCDLALQKYRYESNPLTVTINNLSDPSKAVFGFKNTSILQRGKSCIIDVPC